MTCVEAEKQIAQPIRITETHVDAIYSGNKAAEGVKAVAVILNQTDKFIFS